MDGRLATSATRRLVIALGVVLATVTVTASTDAGVAQGSPALSTADATPPDTTITSGPTGTVAATDATFEFTSTEAGSTFQCQLDDSAFAGCTSPKTLTGLAGGRHTFGVRAVDAAGNADPTPATRRWTISGTPPPDSTPPTTPTGVTAVVDSPTQVTVRWTASTDDVGVVSYQVSRGSDVLADAVTGTSYVDRTATPDTVYSYTVSAADAAGNHSPESMPATVTTTHTFPSVTPTVETRPVPHAGDAADDAAIWVNAADPAASTVIGTDKQGALLVYDLAGRQLQSLPIGRANNVDVRAATGSGTGLSINGTPTSVVAVSNRTDDSIDLFAVDPATRLLRSVAARRITTGMAVLGACMYRSDRSQNVYVFVTGEAGQVQQWQLAATAGGTVDAELVRSFEVGSVAEGCVADDATGALYVAEERVGIWRYGAEPSAATSRRLVAPAAIDGPLAPTIEGLTIAGTGAGGAGYLIASSQGDSTFSVYSRGGSNAYVGSFDIGAANGIDGVDGTDGIDVVTTGLGQAFPSGVFVAQDEQNEGNQNFKLVPYQAVASALR